MENLKLITSSRRLMALAALATGVALPPQSIMAASTAQVVQQSGVVKGQVLDPSGEPVIGATVKVPRRVLLPILMVTSRSVLLQVLWSKCLI